MNKEMFVKAIEEKYGENAQYILNSHDVSECLNRAEWYRENLRFDMVEFKYEEALRLAERYNKNRLTPANAKVGEGATINYYSDSHACTIIKVTKSTITLQRDKATLNKDFTPNIEVGGFAGHCTNQDEQEYTYERDEDGMQYICRWSKKHGCYMHNGMTISKGRHEFYDYNF